MSQVTQPESGYHLRPIAKGKLGDWSKVIEEINEVEDAIDQGNKVMMIVELSDLLGAIEAFVLNETNSSIGLDQLLKMKDATKRAFESGRRG